MIRLAQVRLFHTSLRSHYNSMAWFTDGDTGPEVNSRSTSPRWEVTDRLTPRPFWPRAGADGLAGPLGPHTRTKDPSATGLTRVKKNPRGQRAVGDAPGCLLAHLTACTECVLLSSELMMMIVTSGPDSVADTSVNHLLWGRGHLFSKVGVNKTQSTSEGSMSGRAEAEATL